MNGNGKHTTYKNGDLGDCCYCFTDIKWQIIPQPAKYYYNIFFVDYHLKIDHVMVVKDMTVTNSLVYCSDLSVTN